MNSGKKAKQVIFLILQYTLHLVAKAEELVFFFFIVNLSHPPKHSRFSSQQPKYSGNHKSNYYQTQLS